tara:strand:- start:807 stop:1064 length:258 start_codon:yes stop_codon:yes gene_type:complete
MVNLTDLSHKQKKELLKTLKSMNSAMVKVNQKLAKKKKTPKLSKKEEKEILDYADEVIEQSKNRRVFKWVVWAMVISILLALIIG